MTLSSPHLDGLEDVLDAPGRPDRRVPQFLLDEISQPGKVVRVDVAAAAAVDAVQVVVPGDAVVLQIEDAIKHKFSVFIGSRTYTCCCRCCCCCGWHPK